MITILFHSSSFRPLLNGLASRWDELSCPSEVLHICYMMMVFYICCVWQNHGNVISAFCQSTSKNWLRVNVDIDFLTIFFFSFIFTQSDHSQGWTCLSVWSPPHHHAVSVVSSQLAKLQISLAHVFYSFGVYALWSDHHHMGKQLTVPSVAFNPCVHSACCDLFSVSPLLLALAY